MSEILSLAMPFFGLILLGVLAARLWHLGEEGLAWLNIFLVYFALPALIFLVVAAAPFGQLLNWPFMIAVTSVTICAFAAVTGADDGVDLCGRRSRIRLVRDDVGPPARPVRTTRVGITRGVEHRWRFLVPGHPGVSRGRPSGGGS